MSKKGYLNEDDFYYEIVLSKGKGLLTKKAEIMIKLIGDNTIIKLKNRYKTEDDMNDCLQSGLLFMYLNWNSFNEKRFKVAMPYFTEIFKRGAADGYNKLLNKKSNQEGIPTISLDSCNDGDGFFNI
jgi:hypothetical protein